MKEVKLNEALTFDVLNSLLATESYLVSWLSSKEFPNVPSFGAFN